jgi:hypothetical protein
MKTMKDRTTGKTMNVLLLDGLSEVLEVKELSNALNMVSIFNKNTDSGCVYEVRSAGKTITK